MGPHEVAVPTHLFKVVLAERPSGAGVERLVSAFVMPNGERRERPSPRPSLSVAQSERRTLAGVSYQGRCAAIPTWMTLW